MYVCVYHQSNFSLQWMPKISNDTGRNNIADGFITSSNIEMENIKWNT